LRGEVIGFGPRLGAVLPEVTFGVNFTGVTWTAVAPDPNLKFPEKPLNDAMIDLLM